MPLFVAIRPALRTQHDTSNSLQAGCGSCCAVALAEATATGPGATAVAQATASVPAVLECATGDAAAATAAARAQAPSLGGPSSQVRMSRECLGECLSLFVNVWMWCWVLTLMITATHVMISPGG